jgi:hypothetical protein
MNSNCTRSRICFVILILSIVPLCSFSQCMMAPLSLSKRVVASSIILLGKLKESTPYLSSNNRIFTSNLVEVKAYLKGHSSHKEIIVISEGGMLENRAEIIHPAIELDTQHEIILMLTGDNNIIDNKSFRLFYPTTLQLEAYGCSQGKLTYENGLFYDLLSEAPQGEDVLFEKINRISGLFALTPDGKPYQPRSYNSKPLTNSEISRIEAGISSLSPNPGISGTINVADQLTISGSGFGASPGTVQFSNADDGGATIIQSPVPTTDIISWADNQIVMKVPRQAGTGTVTVNGTFTSPYTVTYAHLEINSTSVGFASSTRQRFYLVNRDGSGGYTFRYNTTFAANAPAVAAFERAVETWRCNTFIHYSVSPTTTSNAVVADDGINTVFFDATLPAGVLGRASSQFQGFSNGGCTQQNTEWFTSDIDVQFQNPPASGYTWNYGPAASVAFGTTYDFESVSLHELGHAHGLGHIIATGKVMNYALLNGSDVRTLDATSDVGGGNAKLAYSSNAANYCIQYPTGVTGPMVLLNAGTCSLPVSLLYFTGKKNNNENLLEWSSLDESNNKGFELSRSYDAENFETIAFIDGKGSTKSKQYYSYTDYVMNAPPSVYYKLIQVDIDNQKTASKIVVIQENDEVKASVYFDPGDKIIYTSLSRSVSEETEWMVYNTSGQVILKDKIANGSNQGFHKVFDLTSGIYYYSIYGNDINLKGKLLVQQVW